MQLNLKMKWSSLKKVNLHRTMIEDAFSSYNVALIRNENEHNK